MIFMMLQSLGSFLHPMGSAIAGEDVRLSRPRPNKGKC